MFGAAADDDQGTARLCRRGLEDEVGQVMEAALERLARSRPQVAPQVDRLVEVGAADTEPIAHPEVLELDPVPTDADTGDQPALAQHVERGELLGDDDGRPLRDHDDARPELHRRRPGGEVGQGQDCVEDPAVLDPRRLFEPAYAIGGLGNFVARGAQGITDAATDGLLVLDHDKTR